MPNATINISDTANIPTQPTNVEIKIIICLAMEKMKTRGCGDRGHLVYPESQYK